MGLRGCARGAGRAEGRGILPISPLLMPVLARALLVGCALHWEAGVERV